MATIAEIRAKYPQYEDMSDEALADALYKKSYSDMPREEFNAKIGLGAQAMPAGPEAPPPLDPNKQNYGMRSYASKTAFLEQLPVIGPAVSEGIDIASAGIRSPFTDLTYQQELDRINENQRVAKQNNPNEEMVGGIAGQVVGSLAAGAAAPRLFGQAAGQGVGAQLGMGMVGNAGLTAADLAARGESAGNILTGAGTAAGLGAAGTLAVQGLGKAGRAGYEYLEPLFRPKVAAERAAGKALAADIRAGTALSEPAFQLAESMGNPMMNVDIGSRNMARLAREATRHTEDVANELPANAATRFGEQVSRVKGAWNEMTGASDLDNLDVLGKLEDAAKTSRKPLYDAAYNHPDAMGMWSSELQQLTKAPDVQDAIRMAIREGKNVAARDKTAVIKHPFVEQADGTLAMRPGITPNLAFWDIVQRELRGMGEKGARNAFGLRKDLNTILDTAVPEFNAARTHAAKIFGGEDLYEEGQKLARKTGGWSDAKRGFSKLTGDERKLFMAGHAKALYNKLSGTVHDQDISRWYNSDDFKNTIEAMYGPTKAREFTTQMSIERAMQKVNTAVKTTGSDASAFWRAVQQGSGNALVGGGFGYYYGGGLGGILGGVAGGVSRLAAQKVTSKARTQMMEEVARLLSSNDPATRAKLMERATNSEAWRDSIDAVANFASRAAGAVAGGNGGNQQ